MQFDALFKEYNSYRTKMWEYKRVSFNTNDSLLDIFLKKDKYHFNNSLNAISCFISNDELVVEFLYHRIRKSLSKKWHIVGMFCNNRLQNPHVHYNTGSTFNTRVILLQDLPENEELHNSIISCYERMTDDCFGSFEDIHSLFIENAYKLYCGRARDLVNKCNLCELNFKS